MIIQTTLLKPEAALIVTYAVDPNSASRHEGESLMLEFLLDSIHDETFVKNFPGWELKNWTFRVNPNDEMQSLTATLRFAHEEYPWTSIVTEAFRNRQIIPCPPSAVYQSIAADHPAIDQSTRITDITIDDNVRYTGELDLHKVDALIGVA